MATHASHSADKRPQRRPRRELKLVDVYAISTGAMFSSGFFLLPGIAFAQAGAWVVPRERRAAFSRSRACRG